MLEHLKLKKHKGIDEVRLNYLSKINVLCGKNNSGKSSILEAIIDEKKRFIGKIFNNDDKKKFFVDQERNISYELYDIYTKQQQSALLQDVLNLNIKIWYDDELTIFKGLINDTNNSKYKTTGLLSSQLESGFLSKFDIIPQNILISPKRNIDTQNSVNASQNVNQQGIGIINKLFYLKNQNSQTAKYQLYESIQNNFKEITNGYTFNVFLEQSNYIKLQFTLNNEDWRNADDCGLGLQDVLVMVYFALSPDYQLILIEEPESHVHPFMQRKLLNFFYTETDKQYILSTHSNVFLDSNYVDKVYFVSYDGTVKVDDATQKTNILNELGYTIADNLVSDLIVLIEGPTDRPVLEEYLIKLELYDKYNIKFWPLGGDIMDQLDLTVFAESNKVVALVDNDPKSNSVRKKFIANCEKYNIEVTRLKRYAIENYFTLRVLKEEFSSQISESVTELDNNKKLEDQIGLNVKNTGKRLAKAMTLEELEGTDLLGFLKKLEDYIQKKETKGTP